MMEVSVASPSQANAGSINRRAADRDMLRQGDKPTRTRNGCANCRKRHRKCLLLLYRNYETFFCGRQANEMVLKGDEVKPTCLNCRQRKETCNWSAKISFKAGNSKHLGAEHPSMRSAINPKRHSLQFQVHAYTYVMMIIC